MPIAVPSGVDVQIANGVITAKGPLGTLTQAINPLVAVNRDGAELKISAVGETTAAAAMSGTFRALVANMVQGVSKGFERKLTLVGVGYRAQAQGATLNLSLGFSHPVAHQMPDGVKCADKQKVGQIAAEVRAYKPPEPYKGKGVRYSDEVVVIKETKKK
jgi:large subunit ribosomal protein L6